MECSMPDLEQVRGFLRAACDGEITFDSLEATYIQAGAGGPVRLLYEAAGRSGGVLRLAARRVAAAKGRQIEAAINARSRSPRHATGFMQAALYAPGLDLLFEVFPVDDRLPSLAVAVDGSAMAARLQSVLARPGAGTQLQSVAAHVMRYKPGRKCLLRYDLAWSAADGEHLPRVVWARVARRSKFDRTRNILPRIHAAAGGLGFDLPEPLGVIPDLAMEFFGPVPGVALFASVQSDTFPQLCGRTGEALRRFHALPVEVEEVFDLDAQLTRLSENAAEFAWISPADAKRIAELEREIAVRVRAAAPSPLRLIHRDFHGDNILVADDRLVLLDFEDCAMGEPADDAGSNWAQLTWHVHRAGPSNARPAAGRQAFIEGYLDSADATTAMQLPAYAAMHCFLYAHQCLRHPQDPGRHEDARVMLAACQEFIERGVNSTDSHL
jgi:hypothetical protein